MSGLAQDFAGYRVLVVGGTRGHGHAIARGFADSGAHVTVTGTMMLPDLYDTDLAGLEHDMVDLTRQDSIAQLVTSVRRLDVLVLAAGCRLPTGLPGSEQAFVAEAVRSGILGPWFLATRLRLRLGQSPVPGGGCVLATGSVRRWLELATPADRSAEELAALTTRHADAWDGIGVRVNTVLDAPRPVVPRQGGPTVAPGPQRARRDTLLRSREPRLQDAVTDLALFLASPSGARITGQTIRVR